MGIFIVVFSILGFISIISPKASWYLSNWWRFREGAEPSRFSLLFYRISGILFIIIAIFLLYK